MSSTKLLQGGALEEKDDIFALNDFQERKTSKVTCSRDVRPRARFASSEEDEAPLARQVGDIRSCKSMAMMMLVPVRHGEKDQRFKYLGLYCCPFR